jgi:Fur family transcriptional regulator, ferric uptake regulator
MRPFRRHAEEEPEVPPGSGCQQSDETDSPATPAGWRTTRQRGAVLAQLGEMDGFHTVKEIHAALHARGEHIGLTTIYRALQALANFGGVDVLWSASGEGLYRLCGPEHHHHLMCRSCGRVVEVAGPTVEAWTERVAAEHGFSDVGHSLEITGTCVECAAKRRHRPTSPW